MNDVKLTNMILLSSGWDGNAIAYQAQNEGAKVQFGQVQSKTELKQEDDEEPDDKKSRLAQYEGMLDKQPAKKLVDSLKNIENKDSVFIFCDQNSLWPYAEELLQAGFTKGLFPTKADYEFEKNREDAMDFVKEHYPDVKIIPHEKYATVEEAKKAVEESDVPLVIQSEGDFVPTICPVDDVEQNHIEILAALDKHAKDYAHGEIILKEKLVQPIEITPQIVFWNGEPVFTDLDIETKNIGDGENNGNQVGCGTNLIIRTELDDLLNEIAFPPKVYEMAKEHTGLFYWDISLYLTGSGIYFGEFCSNRPGYDCLMTECSMSGGVISYFEAIMAGQNPLKSTFGAAARVFNLNRQEDQEITVGKQDCTWLYEATMKDGKMVSVGNGWDLGVITAVGETIQEAVDSLYENISSLTFKEKYTRTKSDFLEDYPTSIIHRFKATNGMLFTAPEHKTKDEQYQEQMDEFKGKVKSKLYGLIRS